MYRAVTAIDATGILATGTIAALFNTIARLCREYSLSVKAEAIEDRPTPSLNGRVMRFGSRFWNYNSLPPEQRVHPLTASWREQARKGLTKDCGRLEYERKLMRIYEDAISVTSCCTQESLSGLRKFSAGTPSVSERFQERPRWQLRPLSTSTK
jgi:hypothetical protein